LIGGGWDILQWDAVALDKNIAGQQRIRVNAKIIIASDTPVI
jgi:hypothetical protein